ncbi:MAG: hypothetical protein Q4C63_05675 [Eubacteriales bacterium]|nr:hypothetical protein [Eubacteriales bacterium]
MKIHAKQQRKAVGQLKMCRANLYRRTGLGLICLAVLLQSFSVPMRIQAASGQEGRETVPEMDENLSGLSATPSVAWATPSGATVSVPMRENGIMPLGAGSSGTPDFIVDPGYFANYVKNLKLSIEKNTAGNLVFRITGRVKGPYWESVGYYHYYWGPYIAFTAYGNKAAPGLIPNANNTNIKKYHIIPDLHHESSMGSYKRRVFINQTDILTAQDTGILAAGKKISMYLSESHVDGDKCRYPKTDIAHVVAYSDNTPAEDKEGSSEYDLDIRLELSDIHEAVTGVYVGAYEYGYYSGAGTDKQANYRVSSSILDGSEAFESAKKGRVKLEFRPGSGSGGPGTVELTAGSTYSPAAPTPPYGSRFLRWNGWNGTVPRSNTVYDAVYEENSYHLRFDTAGGSSAAAIRNVRYSDKSRTFPVSVKKGYELKAWKYTGS